VRQIVPLFWVVRRILAVLVVGWALQTWTAGAAYAQESPRHPSQARYLQLEGYLCELQRPARIYAYSWSVGLGALSVVQTSLAWTVDTRSEDGRAARTGYIVAAGMSGLGMVLVALTARPETNSCKVLRATEVGSSELAIERMHDAERRLATSSRAAQRQTAWWMHGLAGLLGAGVGLGLGLGYPGHALRASLQGVGTFAFMELRIWTRPTRAIGFAQSMGL